MAEENKTTEDKELESLANEFSKKFTAFTDIEGAIIRGHILVEQMLNKSIELTVLNKNEYKTDKFSFAQKAEIGNMLGISTEFKIELNALNKLRNQIAHSLKHEEKYIDVIINNVYNKKSDIFLDKKNKLNSLKTSISFMCGAISFAHVTARQEFIIHEMKMALKRK
jgi:hypothetical protein